MGNFRRARFPVKFSVGTWSLRAKSLILEGGSFFSVGYQLFEDLSFRNTEGSP